LENVMAAARTAMQGKMSGHAAARFHARWETHAVRLHEELAAGTWQPGTYTYFDIHEPKLRRVAAASFRDRVVHHALVRVLEPIFEKKFIEVSYACRKGKAPTPECAAARNFPVGFPTSSSATCAGISRASTMKSCCNASAGSRSVGRACGAT
jgi:retron-type reverse transcriptase